jgi:hypothetical protein
MFFSSLSTGAPAMTVFCLCLKTLLFHTKAKIHLQSVLLLLPTKILGRFALCVWVGVCVLFCMHEMAAPANTVKVK